MKKNLWLLCGLMVSSALLARQATNPPGAPIETPAPAPATTAPALTDATAGSTNAPAAKTPKKKSGKKKSNRKPQRKIVKKPAPRKAPALASAAYELKTVPLVPGSAVVIASRVNVRGQPKLKSEIVTRLTNGEPVTVLEEVTLKNSAPDEPSAWAKILLPPGAHVWISSLYVDESAKTVKARKLNLRSGPGENYSVLGLLEKGDGYAEIGAKEGWIEIEAPTNAFAFVAAQYLKQEEPEAPAVATLPTAPPPTVAAAPETPSPAPATPPPVLTPPNPTVAAAPVETKPAAEPPPPAPTVLPPAEPPAIVQNPIVTPQPAAPPIATPPPAVPEVVPPPVGAAAPPPATETKGEPTPRVVLREGKVRGMTSIQAPSHFELISLENGKTIDYLYTTSTNLDLRRYKGLRIVVSGEEGLDARWGNTPILTIQKIQVLPEPEADFDMVPPASK